MKHSTHFILGLLLWLLNSSLATAQALTDADTILVSDKETTYLLFPEEVKLVDIGRIGEYAASIEGKSVFLKALNKEAGFTNLLIRYGEEYFMAKLLFAPFPKKNLFDYRGQANATPLKPASMHEKEDLLPIKTKLSSLSQEKEKGIEKRVRHGMKLSITHLKNDRKALYLGLALANHSSIDYEIDFVGFSLRERRGKWFSKNNHFQKELMPLVSEGPTIIRAQAEGRLFYALPLYAMTSRGRLHLILREKHGSRILRIAVPARKINHSPSFDHGQEKNLR